MGFISYTTEVYRKLLDKYDKQDKLDTASLYDARKYLKYIDDLLDEGYTGLRDSVETQFRGYSRLKELVLANGAEPFTCGSVTAACESRFDTSAEYELNGYIADITNRVKDDNTEGRYHFIDEMLAFSRYIKSMDSDSTAFVFLLRDTLIPYIDMVNDAAFGKGKAYPLLIGRRFFELLSGQAGFDDKIRGIIIDAFEHGATDFEQLWKYCREKMAALYDEVPAIKQAIQELLLSIHAKRIIIVESGVHGTIPLFLMAADKRAEMRMYTAAPFLYPMYKDICYTEKYENNRLFETVACQDGLFQISGYKNGSFFVNETADVMLKIKALNELRYAIS